MEFDEQTMSWKAVGEKAQREEEELMAGFDVTKVTMMTMKIGDKKI